MNFENNGIITDNILSRETPPHLPQPPNDVVLIGSPQNNLISPSVAIPVSTSSSLAGGAAASGGTGSGGGPSSHNQHKSNADNVVQPVCICLLFSEQLEFFSFIFGVKNIII